MMKKLKKIIFCLVVALSFSLSNSNVYALDNEYGIYCAYSDYYFIYSGSSKSDVFNIVTNFDELGVLIESDRPGKALFEFAEDSNGTKYQPEIKWLEEKNMLDDNGNLVCPSNPFGQSLGNATSKECGTEGCKIASISSVNETYTCNYLGESSKKNLILNYVQDSSSVNWNITYPNGTTETLTNGKTNGNFMPGKTCNDIYYVYSTNKIMTATSEETFNDLCKSYAESDIEHFCSGKCTYSNRNCPSTSNVDNDKCQGILTDEMINILNRAIKYIRIIAPILLVIFGFVDFGKAVLSDDKDELKKATSKFTKRAIIVVVIFFVPLIVGFLIDAFNSVSDKSITDLINCGIK